jgi:hypothetical protein
MGILNEDGKTKVHEGLEMNFEKRFSEMESLGESVPGFSDLMNEIRFLKDHDQYARLMDAYRSKNKFYSAGVHRDDFLNSPLIKIAEKYLYKPDFILNPHALKDTTFPTLLRMYKFCEYFYYMNKNNPLNFEDMQNIYYSDLVAQVILSLDNFDDNQVQTESKIDFFENLNEGKWEKESKELYGNIDRLLSDLSNLLDYSWDSFGADENMFVSFLCFCSAASDDRVLVSESDVIRAYKTYFKLLMTDVTVFKADPEVLNALESESNSSVEKFPKLRKYLDDPVKMVGYWLKAWGTLFMLLGLALAVSFKYPFFQLGLFFVFTGLLSFLFINRLVCVYYGAVTLGLGLFAFMNNLNLQGISLVLLSLILFNKAWKFPK